METPHAWFDTTIEEPDQVVQQLPRFHSLHAVSAHIEHAALAARLNLPVGKAQWVNLREGAGGHLEQTVGSVGRSVEREGSDPHSITQDSEPFPVPKLGEVPEALHQPGWEEA